MKLEEIEIIAEKYKKLLEPFCKRCEIAGSIRRRKSECSDIEIVIVVDEEHIINLKALVGQWKKVKGEVTGKYTQRVLPEGIKLDLFIAKLDNWGNIFLIRTGNWRFSRYMMGIRAKELGFKHSGGYLWRHGVKVPCFKEDDIFDYLKMDYVKPEDREWD